MGSLQAREMAQAIENNEVTLRQAIVWHLRSNCFPAPPMAMVDVALDAIRSIELGDDDADIELPDGIRFRHGTTVLPWEVVETFHLVEFIDAGIDGEHA